MHPGVAGWSEQAELIFSDEILSPKLLRSHYYSPYSDSKLASQTFIDHLKNTMYWESLPQSSAHAVICIET